MAMVQRAHGRRTVPQIFIGDTHVGGYDDMAALERRGKLDPLLVLSCSQGSRHVAEARARRPCQRRALFAKR